MSELPDLSGATQFVIALSGLIGAIAGAVAAVAAALRGARQGERDQGR